MNARLLHEIALVPAIIVALIAGTIVNDAFLTQQNLINILQQSSELAILVIGETLILLAGKFDLSLESVVGVAPMIAGWLVTAKLTGGSGLRLNAYIAVAILFVVGILVGAINGFLSAMVADEALISYDLSVTATRADEIAGRAIVNAIIRPTFSIDYVAVTLTLE